MYQKYSFHPIWFTGNASSHIKMTQKMCCGSELGSLQLCLKWYAL